MSKYTEAIESGLAGIDYASPGICPGCQECSDTLDLTFDELDAAIEAGTALDDGGFSWSPCDCCGSSLGGNRYAAHGFDKERNIIHLDICVDCLHFLANGDEPENWEG